MSDLPPSSSVPTPEYEPRALRRGLIDGAQLPSFMVGSSMLGYGALVNSADMGIWIAVLSTIGIYGLPGQVAFVEYYLLGLPVMSLVLAISLANMRFFPMVLSFVPHLRRSPKTWACRFLIVQTLSVNTWAGFFRKMPQLKPEDRGAYYNGFSLSCMFAACLGTFLGYLLADIFTETVKITLVFLNPVYFIFVFAAATARAGLLAFGVGAVLGPPLYLLSPEWSLPVCGVLAGTVGFFADDWLKKRRGATG